MGWKFTLLLIVFAFIGGFMRGYSDGREKVLKKVKKTLKQLDRIAVDNGFNQKRIMFEDVQRGFGWVKLERKR